MFTIRVVNNELSFYFILYLFLDFISIFFILDLGNIMWFFPPSFSYITILYGSV